MRLHRALLPILILGGLASIASADKFTKARQLVAGQRASGPAGVVSRIYDTSLVYQNDRKRGALLLSRFNHAGELVSQTAANRGSIRDYERVGQFSVPGLGHGTALMSRMHAGAKTTTIRMQFEPTARPVLDGKSRLTFVIGPKEGWTEASPTIEAKSLNIYGNLAQTTVSMKRIQATFGSAEVAFYARIDRPGATPEYVNLDGRPLSNIPGRAR